MNKFKQYPMQSDSISILSAFILGFIAGAISPAVVIATGMNSTATIAHETGKPAIEIHPSPTEK